LILVPFVKYRSLKVNYRNFIIAGSWIFVTVILLLLIRVCFLLNKQVKISNIMYVNLVT